jgi:hypothetical protein
VGAVCALLIEHLSDPSKRRDAMFMIEQAIQFEADFFRVGRIFGTTVHVMVSGAKSLEFDYSLHLYHTTHRLYATIQPTRKKSRTV